MNDPVRPDDRIETEPAPVEQAEVHTGQDQHDDLDTARKMPTMVPSDEGSLESGTIPGVDPGQDRIVLEGDAVAGYDLLGELGRGGMGVVYKARDQKLKRIVALKMILSGAHASDEDMQRFQTEAEAVAKLQHPNIVQIYEVSEHEGRPYIALEFADGGSLDQKIAGTPQNAHESALLVETLARAMQQAHDSDVIHRDLKPANILLTSDGVPRITDFGLAKRMDEDSSQTKSGAVIGTPSYMAPEQAGNISATLGPAADTYALGAILYHLLTGRPPFQAETQLDTIMQVISDEPVAPRKLNSSLPVDLETICLKCLEKDIHRRYESAKALAEDLRRFAANEPIHARPVSALTRGVKWTRRRPAVAGMIGISAVALVALVAGGLWYNGQLKGQRDVARQRENEAKNAQREADQQRLLAQERERETEEQRELAIEARDEAARQKEVAEQNLQLALRAVDEYMTAVGEHRLLNTPGMETLQRELLQGAQQFYVEFVKQDSDDAGLKHALGEANQRLSEILAKLGDHQGAIRASTQQQVIYEDLLAENPEEAAYLEGLASAHSQRGVVLLDLDRNEEALQAQDIAIEILERLVEEYPLAVDYRRGLVVSYINRAVVLQNTGKPETAITIYRKANVLSEQLLREDPGNFDNSLRWAASCNNIGICLERMRQPGPAGEEFNRTISILRPLAAEQPGIVALQLSLASAMGNQARVLDLTGEGMESLQFYNQALSIFQRLSSDHPDVPLYTAELAKTHDNISRLLNENGQFDAAEEAARKAVEIYGEVTAGFPELVVYQADMANSLNNLGSALDKSGQFGEAAGACRAAITVYEKLVKGHAERPQYQIGLGKAFTNLGAALRHDGKLGEAAAAHRGAIGARQKLVEDFPRIGGSGVDLAASTLNLGSALQAQGKNEDALQVFNRGVRMIEKEMAMDNAAGVPLVQVIARNLHWSRAQVLVLLARYEQAIGDWDKALSFNPGNRREFFWLERVKTRALAGHHLQATNEALELSRVQDIPPSALCELASVFCISGVMASKDEELSPEDRKQVAAEYDNGAMQILGRQSVKTWLKDPVHLNALKQRTEMERLRQRADFKQMVSELEAGNNN